MAYTPPFTRCANTLTPARPLSSACQNIIDTMPIDNVQSTFGARGVEGVTFVLPILLTDRESFFFFLPPPSRAAYTSFVLDIYVLFSCDCLGRWRACC